MPRRGVIVVGTTAITVLEANPNRVKVSMVNQSDNEITVTKGHARINEGDVLKAGGSFSDQRDSFGYIYKDYYSAIASGANSNLSFTEE